MKSKSKKEEQKNDNVDTLGGIAAEQIETYKAQIAELANDLQRIRADFENYRKQVEAQKAQGRKVAEQATVLKFLPLLDDLDRALDSYEELKPLSGSMEKTLGGLGLTRISSESGVEFNPDIHDAVMVEGDGDKEEVSETLRTGYYYEGAVLRPDMVKVRKI